MYIERTKSKPKDKTYRQVLLRESFREPGALRSRVKKRTLLNLTKYPASVVDAIEFALKNKGNLSNLKTIDDIDITQGPSIGALWVVLQTVRRLGIEKALGRGHNGKLALWQIIARVLDQGSRLSAVRLAQSHAAASAIDFDRGFCEDDLYQNLTWLAENQSKIEKRLFTLRRQKKPQLYLYDVTSSYLEGDQNALADWGYNRDKKRGKKQIVIGLLCDAQGEPVSTEVFRGNTCDINTFKSQIRKTATVFECERVTFVGDRGMIKSGQIEDLAKVGFNYITAITKPQIRSMIKKEIIQLGLFDENLCEVEYNAVRYILRRNPIRAEELTESRLSKLKALKTLSDRQNQYLAEHPKAVQHKARMKVVEKMQRLGISAFVTVTAKNRCINVEVDEQHLDEIAELDGCYTIKTDLPVEIANTEAVHARYKDLIMVENAFRTSKTAHLEVRPIYVRTEANTRGHVLVVMLSYLVVRALKKSWSGFDMTVEEGLDSLKRICSMKMKIKAGGTCLRVPKPDEQNQNLLEALDVRLPTVLPEATVMVATKKKLIDRRNK